MFKQAAAIWNRLVGSRPVAAAATATEKKERRSWARFPAQVEVRFMPTTSKGDSAILGKVLDVSRGGVKLLVDRCLEKGTLLSLDLPGGEAASRVSVLACVVRCEAQPNGKCILGCSFSRELGTEDLQRFGVAPAKPAQTDQRGWLRFDCNVNATYEEPTADPVIRREAQVANLSAAGVALVVDTEVSNGAMLSVDLHKSSGALVTSILACVVHIVVLPDGKRVLGCNFIRALNEEHINELLFETTPLEKPHDTKLE
jgi:hypothetical protein